ncbi:MAG: hypothetical protein N2037_08995 [Acidimicrobiales bacterium]|nr:hypothetical protein [Acidimicrobiales bacterium]
MSWVVRRLRGDAGTLQRRELAARSGREVWIMETCRPALVLGSTQHDGDVDPEAATGLDIVQRESGGGAVLVRPGGHVWIDLIVPRVDPLWDDDIGRSFLWLGEVWQRALRSLGVDCEVHRSPPPKTGLSAVACFAGTGWGEVVGTGGKLVGISQRRTRVAARFQSVCYVADPGPLPLRGLSAHDQQVARPALIGAVPAEVVQAFVASLPP